MASDFAVVQCGRRSNLLSAIPGSAQGIDATQNIGYVPVDRESTLPDGETIDGIDKLKEYLVIHRKSEFARGLTERIVCHWLCQCKL